jgi:hypothetical protein
VPGQADSLIATVTIAKRAICRSALVFQVPDELRRMRDRDIGQAPPSEVGALRCIGPAHFECEMPIGRDTHWTASFVGPPAM